MEPIKHHYRTCNICEAMCGLDIKHRGTEILSIKGDKDDPFSQGHICPKAVALQDYYHDSDRLKTPIKRTADGWQDISWDAAFDEISTRLRAIQQAHGRNAVGVYLGNPNAHNYANALTLPSFFKALGSNNRFSSASADQLPHHVASNYMLGAGLLIPVPDIDRTDFWLIIGGNPVVSNGSMMSAAGVERRLKAIQQRGGQVVVVDPRRTETAKKADQHLFIQPETDALLLAAMLHTLFTDGLVSLGHWADRVRGLEELETAVSSYSAEVVAPLCGIDAPAIRNLAHAFAKAKHAVCYSRMGASTQTFGGLCQWLTNALNIVTGNFDREGGAMFPQPAFEMVRPKKGKPSSYGRFTSRVRGLPYFNSEFPVSTLADEILTDGDEQIRAMLTIAGNPVLSSPDGDRLNGAFESLDFMVAVDIYLNETTRHADIILPAATGLEVPHFDVFFNAFAVRNTVKYSQPLFEKKPQQRFDWEILKALALRLTGLEDDGSTPEQFLDAGLQQGAYGHMGMSLAHLNDNPHGVDLGALQICLAQRIQTEDGCIALAPQLFLDDLPRLTQWMAEQTRLRAEFPFTLISRRLARSHNTWTQNSRRLVKGKNPVTVQMHSDDAAKLQLSPDQTVRVVSRVGAVELPVVINDDIFPGVISIPQGWGHHYEGTEMNVAATQPGVNINALTDTTRIDKLTGNAAFNGTPVSIEVI